MGKNRVPPISVRLPADTYQKFLHTCEDTGQSKHGFIVKAVEAALYNYHQQIGEKHESKTR